MIAEPVWPDPMTVDDPHRTSVFTDAPDILLRAKEPQDSVYGLFRCRTFAPEISGAWSRNHFVLFCDPETFFLVYPEYGSV